MASTVLHPHSPPVSPPWTQPPPPPPGMDTAQWTSLPGRGRALIATAAAPAGSVLLEEEPLWVGLAGGTLCGGGWGREGEGPPPRGQYSLRFQAHATLGCNLPPTQGHSSVDARRHTPKSQSVLPTDRGSDPSGPTPEPRWVDLHPFALLPTAKLRSHLSTDSHPFWTVLSLHTFLFVGKGRAT